MSCRLTWAYKRPITRCTAFILSSFNKSFPESFGKSASPSFTEEIALARFVCYCCTVPTADESNHSAAVTLHARCSATYVIYVTLRVRSPQITEICPFLSGDINPQISHWNNGKMKITYNSAYVQIKTLNFTFTQQAVIVYFYLCSNFQEIAMLNTKY